MLADERKDKLEKNRRDGLGEGKLGDSSASTRYYVAAGTNLYKKDGETGSQLRGRERESEWNLGGII